MSSVTEQIKERLDIIDVIGGYIKVEKSGINWKARCPFHNEKTPSFFISSTRQSFYCFGCGEKGDIFSFVEKFEGLDFKGALETLADRAGVELKKYRSEEILGKDNENKEREKLFEILEEATKIFEQNLKENKMALEYLKGRGLTESSITKWRVGFAKDEWRNLHDALIGKGYSKENLLEVGLIKKVPNESKFYDTFRNRIMFPISDSAGRVIAFSGRAMKEDEKTPKYLNSPETKLFYKSEVLYGFHIAKNYIRKLDYTVLVEGQMDLCMSHQAGVPNTVASSGTALTELHLKKLQKLSNRVIIAYDSDTGGEKASRRAAELALSLGMEVKITSLKEGEDPASIIREDPEIWKTALRESVNVVDFYLSAALIQKKDRDLAKEIFKNVLPLVSLIKSEMEKSQFVKKIALKMRVSEDAVWSDLKKTEKLVKEEVHEDSQKTHDKSVNLERIMVGIIFLEETKKSKISKTLIEKWQEIVGEEEILKILSNYENEKEALIFEAESHGLEKDLEKAGEDLLRRIELQTLKTRLQKVAITLDDGSLSKEESKKAEAEFEKIQKRIKEIG